MILAAGLGTRLRPLTDETPKALIEVGGCSMLERVAGRLAAAGADRIIVNVHHHANEIEEFLGELEAAGRIVAAAPPIADRPDRGHAAAAQQGGPAAVRFLVSREPDRPLETGGGLAHAAPLFRRDGPFLLHNVDIITDVDLQELHRAEHESGALATLAVQRRASSRRLLFDEDGLCGFEGTRADADARVLSRETRGEVRPRAFAGIHAISPGIFDLMTPGVYSIIDAYVELAGAGHSILPFDVSDAEWLEVGTPERLARAREAGGRPENLRGAVASERLARAREAGGMGAAVERCEPGLASLRRALICPTLHSV